MTRNGLVVSESTYQMNWAKRANWQHAQETLARAVLSETIDMERMRQAEFMHRLEEIAKAQNVRRIRVSSLQ